mgnify:CR=1 FL=1
MDEAVRIWRQMAACEPIEFYPVSELAKYLEHRARDYGQAKAIIDHVVSQYNINKSKISLTCHSDGCWGGTALVRNNSTFFSSLVAVASSAPSSNSASGFTSTKIYYWYGTSDADSTNRSAFVNSINQAGGQAYIKSIAGGHNIMKQVYIDNKMIEWMLSQSR